MKEALEKYFSEYGKEPIRRKVYICSQYGTLGDRESNVELAKAYTMTVLEEGSIPICPHLFFDQVLNDDCFDQRAVGMMTGLEMMKSCDEIRVYSRLSEGMKNEIILAERLHIPVNVGNMRCIMSPGEAEKFEKTIAKELEELRYGEEHYPKAY